MFKHIPNGKGIVYGPMEYNPNGKDISALMEYTVIVYSPYGKGIGFMKNVLRSGNRHGNR